MSASVVIVGRGRMGSAFERSFRRSWVKARSYSGREIAAAKVPALDGPRLWILAVRDDAIASCARSLADAGRFRRGDTVVHLAGARGVDELSSAKAAGAHIGALHPLVAVASTEAQWTLSGLCASFEGGAAALKAVRRAMKAIGLEVRAISAVDRVRYHAAAALVATGSVAIAQGASALFRASAEGVDGEVASRFAASLLLSASRNVGDVGAERALASPLLRGDTETVRKHLATMRETPTAEALYRAALAQVLLALERDGAVDATVIAAAKALL